MASNPGDDKQPQQPPLDPNQKALNVWAKPVDEAANPNRQPTISEAVSTIKAEDFTSIANTPCSRNGFLTGIASGFGIGGLRFILTGSSLLAGQVDIAAISTPVNSQLTGGNSHDNRQCQKVFELGGRILCAR